MATWFECKFKFNQDQEDGGVKPVSETYLIDAVSFTDAEARVYDEIGANYRDFVLQKVAKYKVHELLHIEDGGITWYKTTVAMTTIDEEAGKERKTRQVIVVNGQNIKEAYERVEDVFAGSVSDYEILSIAKTPVVEVLPYVDEDSKRNLVPLEAQEDESNEPF